MQIFSHKVLIIILFYVFRKIFAKILARLNLIAYLCHRYNYNAEHSA